MKTLIPFLAVAAVVLAGDAATYHRSFKNGYPTGARGVAVRQQPNAAVLTAPKTKATGAKSLVVTNRVVLTKEQAEKLLKNKKRYRKVESKAATSDVK